MDFAHRSYKKELLDEPGISFNAIKRNMQELDTINHLLGGHRITLKGLEKIIGSLQQIPQPLRVAEVGCGGGDNLAVIKDWARKKDIPIVLTGVDWNKECIAFAKGQPKNKGIQFICSDYRKVQFEQKPHIIFSSLFCHHFTDEELVEMLHWKRENSEIGFFINDLHRHPLAYYSIKSLTAIFSRSFLVKNDAPLSVLRGFKKEEWQMLFHKAHISNFKCKWQWAFRWLVTCVH